MLSYDKQSRYYNSTILEYIYDSKKRFIIERDFFYSIEDLGNEFDLYKIEPGDELDLIAYKVCEDSTKGWVIMDINREIIDDALELPTGETIVVPTSTFFNEI